MSDKEDDEMPLAEEDYDPRMFEEQKERARQNRDGNIENLPELTVTQANLSKLCKESKLHADAV